MSATQLNPALCAKCRKRSTLSCPDCDNAKYCSQACLHNDGNIHSKICEFFPPIEPRPSESHYLALFFPANENLSTGSPHPRFVWMRHHHNGDRLDDLVIDRSHVHELVSGNISTGDMRFDCHRDLNRQFNCNMMVWHDNGMQGNKAPINESLCATLGEKETADWNPSRWKGGLLVNAYKGRLDEVRHKYWGTRTEELFVPMDLDTMALGPVLAFLKWRSKEHGEYELKRAANKLDTPQEAKDG
jgi:hypothetical protein